MTRVLVTLTSLAILGAVAVIAFPPPARAGDFRPIDLGVVQYAHASGTAWSDAYDVNDFGQVTGYSRTDPQDWQSATVWQPSSRLATTGALHEVSAIAGFSYPPRQPSPINNRGQFFVRSSELFTPDTPNTLTGTIRVTQDGFPNTVGQQPGTRNGMPVRVEPDGTVTPLGALGPGSGNGQLLNDFGQVTGDSDDRYFLWTPHSPGGTQGQMVDLGLPVTIARRYELVALSGQGAVGLRFSNFPAPHQTGSYLWRPHSPNSPTGELIALDALLNQPIVTLIDVNDVGQLLAEFTEEDGQSRGYFLLTPDSSGNYEPFRLDDIAVTLPGGAMFRNLGPSALNNFGWVVGAGAWSYDGGATWQTRATILPIPEPALGLVIPAAALLLMRGRPLHPSVVAAPTHARS